MKLRWYLDLAIVGRTIVGRTYQLAVEGSTGKGQVRQVGKWAAFGMKADWNDTPLGEEFATRAEAMLAVASWYESAKQPPTYNSAGPVEPAK